MSTNTASANDIASQDPNSTFSPFNKEDWSRRSRNASDMASPAGSVDTSRSYSAQTMLEIHGNMEANGLLGKMVGTVLTIDEADANRGNLPISREVITSPLGEITDAERPTYASVNSTVPPKPTQPKENGTNPPQPMRRTSGLRNSRQEPDDGVSLGALRSPPNVPLPAPPAPLSRRKTELSASGKNRMSDELVSPLPSTRGPLTLDNFSLFGPPSGSLTPLASPSPSIWNRPGQTPFSSAPSALAEKRSSGPDQGRSKFSQIFAGERSSLTGKSSSGSLNRLAGDDWVNIGAPVGHKAPFSAGPFGGDPFSEEPQARAPGSPTGTNPYQSPAAASEASDSEANAKYQMSRLEDLALDAVPYPKTEPAFRNAYQRDSGSSYGNRDSGLSSAQRPFFPSNRPWNQSEEVGNRGSGLSHGHSGPSDSIEGYVDMRSPAGTEQRGNFDAFSPYQASPSSEELRRQYQSLNTPTFTQQPSYPFGPLVPGAGRPAGVPPMDQERKIMLDPGQCPWYYIDVMGIERGPFTGYEMQGWFQTDSLPRDLLIRKGWDTEYMLLATFHQTQRNMAEPFHPPQLAPPKYVREVLGINPSLTTTPGVPAPAAAPVFGTVLTAADQNALEQRKQEEATNAAREREQAAIKIQAVHAPRRPGPGGMYPQGLIHQSSQLSLHSQPSYGSMNGGMLHNQPSYGNMMPGAFPVAPSMPPYSQYPRAENVQRSPPRNRNGPTHSPPRLSYQDPNRLSSESFDRAQQGRSFRENLAQEQLEYDRANADGQNDPEAEAKAKELADLAEHLKSLHAEETSRPSSHRSGPSNPASNRSSVDPSPPGLESLQPSQHAGVLPTPFPPAPRRQEQFSAPSVPPPAPWANTTAASRAAPLSQIQEEDRQRRAAAEAERERQKRTMHEQQRLNQPHPVAPAPGLPSNASWATRGAQMTASSPWAAAAANIRPQQIANAPKSIEEIQQEEQARKRRAAASTPTAAPGMPAIGAKTYAGLAGKATAPSPVTVGSDWQTVAAGGRTAKPATPVRSASSSIASVIPPRPVVNRSSTTLTPMAELNRWTESAVSTLSSDRSNVSRFLDVLAELPLEPRTIGDALSQIFSVPPDSAFPNIFAQHYVAYARKAKKGENPDTRPLELPQQQPKDDGWSTAVKKEKPRPAQTEASEFSVVQTKKKGKK